jgi:hypothetical protein
MCKNIRPSYLLWRLHILLSVFPWQQEKTAIMGEIFPLQSMPRCYNQELQELLAAAVPELFELSPREFLVPPEVGS